jgi:SAM-dependent methyltransferase
MRVLEIGGGNGYQARELTSWGCPTSSIDLADRPAGERYFPVDDYDGMHIPFPDGAFDRVFSSCVLEHVSALPPLLGEIRRVLKPAGLAVHVVPSPVWRLSHSLAHYGYLVKYLLGFRGNLGVAPAGAMVRERGWLWAVRLAMLSPAHGDYPNAVAELYYYSKSRWTSVFRKNGFEILEIARNGLFYTGYDLLPALSPIARSQLANVLGSSMYVFATRRQGPSS